MKKTQLLHSINDLLEEFSIDELIEHLLVIEKIEKGRSQIKESKINIEDQAKKNLSKWLK